MDGRHPGPRANIYRSCAPVRLGVRQCVQLHGREDAFQNTYNLLLADSWPDLFLGRPNARTLNVTNQGVVGFMFGHVSYTWLNYNQIPMPGPSSASSGMDQVSRSAMSCTDSSQALMVRRQRPRLPTWQWLLAWSAAVKTRVVTDRALVRFAACLCSWGRGT